MVIAHTVHVGQTFHFGETHRSSTESSFSQKSVAGLLDDACCAVGWSTCLVRCGYSLSNVHHER